MRATPEQQQRAVYLYVNCLEYCAYDIEEECRLSRGQVLRAVKKAGVPLRTGREQKPDWERDQRQADVRAAYKAGETLKVIVERSGYSERTVLRIVKRARIPRRCPPAAEERWERAMEMARAGRSLAAIVRKIGVGREGLRARVVAAGIKIRPPGIYYLTDRSAGAVSRTPGLGGACP